MVCDNCLKGYLKLVDEFYSPKHLRIELVGVVGLWKCRHEAK